MRKIVLASGSAQRKKLLRQLGLKFTIKVSGADEIQKIQTTPAALVIKNALLKARDVAGKSRDAVVIGADTIVYIGKKRMILKPRSLKEAKKKLKVLFSRPQWVYTGVAVIDAKTGRTHTGYEKTKVFMMPLTDTEIGRYYKKINPFDKAGGFDIEGWGSAFIGRIEGCYTNVIGLPMAKLRLMLKKFGIYIL